MHSDMECSVSSAPWSCSVRSPCSQNPWEESRSPLQWGLRSSPPQTIQSSAGSQAFTQTQWDLAQRQEEEAWGTPGPSPAP